MENIQVALRLRPLNKRELYSSEEIAWKIPNPMTVCLDTNHSKDLTSAKKMNTSTKTTFNFDHCFGADADNIQVYDTLVKRVALSSLNGINGTVFMYGQTGSGKTYSMMGYNRHEDQKEYDTCVNQSRSKSRTSPGHFYEEKPEHGDLYETFDKGNYLITDVSPSTGVLVLSLRDIFQAIEKDMDKTYFLRCSYIEIYNDMVFDLLKPADKLGETLTVNEDQKKDFYIKGVTEESVSSISEILEKLKKGESNRHYARTNMNHSSSRSHTIFRLLVQTVTNTFIREYRRQKREKSPNINNDELKHKFSSAEKILESKEATEGTMVTESLLNFVDLAGSEKISSHHHVQTEDSLLDEVAQGIKIRERIREGQHINKSLFFLTQVISLKSEGKSNAHIPYRNSPLTKILRSSLGGNSRTLIILCATPALSQYEQTMSTLRFGVNAKKIENKVTANIITNNDNEALKILITDYEKKLKDVENTRAGDLIKQAQLMRQIEELQLTKKNLTERLSQLVKFNANKLIESISDDYLSQFFCRAKQKVLHADRAGLLILPACLNKYDSYDKIPRGRKHEPAEDDEAMETAHNEPDLVFDAEGRYALHALKAAKQRNQVLLKKIEAYQNNFEKILGLVEEYFQDRVTTDNRIKEFENKIKELVLAYNDQSVIADNFATQLAFFKNLEGLSKIEDGVLEELESMYLRNLGLVNREKAKRFYQDKISKLESQLGVQSSSIDDVKNGISEAKKLDFEEINRQLRDLEIPMQPEQLMKLDELKRDILAQFTAGIDKIDVELTEATKRIDDSELNYRKRVSEKSHKIIPKNQAEKPKKAGKRSRENSISSVGPQWRSPKSASKLDFGKTLDELTIDSNAFITKKDQAEEIYHTPTTPNGVDRKTRADLKPGKKKSLSTNMFETSSENAKYQSLTPKSDPRRGSQERATGQNKENSLSFALSKEESVIITEKEAIKSSAKKPPISRSYCRTEEDVDRSANSKLDCSLSKTIIGKTDFEASGRNQDTANFLSSSPGTKFRSNSKLGLANLTKSLRLPTGKEGYFENMTKTDPSPRELTQTSSPYGGDMGKSKQRSNQKDKNVLKTEPSFRKLAASPHQRGKTSLEGFFATEQSIAMSYATLRNKRKNQQILFNQSVADSFEKSLDGFGGLGKEESKTFDCRTPISKNNKSMDRDTKVSPFRVSSAKDISKTLRTQGHGSGGKSEMLSSGKKGIDMQLNNLDHEALLLTLTNIEQNESLFTNSMFTMKDRNDETVNLTGSSKLFGNMQDSPTQQLKNIDLNITRAMQEQDSNKPEESVVEGKKRRPRAQRVKSTIQQ